MTDPPALGSRRGPQYEYRMKVIVSNFGFENWAWPDCLNNGTITVMDDERVHPFYLAGDRAGYIRAAQEYLRAPGEEPVSTATASRWYNGNDIVMGTVGDLWIHRSDNLLWWTISADSKPTCSIVDEPKPRWGGKVVAYVYQKKCPPWSNRSRAGTTLEWAALHPKARDFLVTRASFASLSDDNAMYAQRLIEGGDLSPWHGRPDWKLKQAGAKQGTGKVYDALEKTSARIAMTVMQTVAASGAISIEQKKNKECRFPSQQALEAYIKELLASNQLICALTGLTMQVDGEVSDDALRVSLDRKDSDGHYERGNLQLVCKFANAWKGAQVDDEFRRLVQLVRLER